MQKTRTYFKMRKHHNHYPKKDFSLMECIHIIVTKWIYHLKNQNDRFKEATKIPQKNPRVISQLTLTFSLFSFCAHSFLFSFYLHSTLPFQPKDGNLNFSPTSNLLPIFYHCSLLKKTTCSLLFFSRPLPFAPSFLC